MMLNRQTVRTVRGSLLLACVLFTGTTVYELVRPFPVPPATVLLNKEKTPTGPEVATERDIPPRSAFSEIVERPLFRENRRPYISPRPEPKSRTEGPDISEQIRLSAVVITGSERLALIQTAGNGKLQKLRPGDSVNGWALTKIQSSSISMKKGRRTSQIAFIVTPSQPAPREPQNELETMPVNPEENAGKPVRRKPAPRQ